jgi:dTDP-4-amino-4,6-dideoxy-D-galactose acyltransferase
MKLEKQQWDTDFFKKSVWRMDLSLEDQPQEIISRLVALDYDVVYVMFPEALEGLFSQTLLSHGGNYVDCRVTYLKRVAYSGKQSDTVLLSAPTLKVRQLAYTSGQFSRFKTDKNFEPDFCRLYDRWIDNAFKSLTGAVFGAYDDQSNLIGMVTVDGVEKCKGKIGLIAVDEQCRGMGVGSRLLKACDAYYEANSLEYAEVVTQDKNRPAIKLYEKNGYEQSDRTSVWHVWRQ